MRHIMVMNAKGGCGKSTLATNIASWFANEGASVALADFDPQRSALDWLERRPDDRPQIVGFVWLITFNQVNQVGLAPTRLTG